MSEKTGVSLDRLYELNPDIDVNALREGQKIRLVADRLGATFLDTGVLYRVVTLLGLHCLGEGIGAKGSRRGR